jgi:peptidyl-prolyl cis-trans isomerase SurA
MMASWPIALCFAVAGEAPTAVIVDRVAVVVDKHVIKLSDILRDLYVTEFLNQEPLRIDPEAKRKSAERLIDQTIIAEDMARGGYAHPPESEADATLQELARDRFGGSGARMRNELARYSLTKAELREQLLWQLTVLRFIDERFRPGVQVGDDEVRSYYDQHLAALNRQYPNDYRFETLEPQIRQSLEGGAVNQNFEEWLDESRKRAHFEYRPEAFQ